ncbi:MAG: hypothetical protein J6R59_01360 [Paludibacteraceae bacterium]|nr:hypothetical protein [Paludibacteraceae bacterium]
MAKVYTVAVRDTHSISLYDASTGGYEGIIYVTSGSIIGNPIISSNSVTVTFTENGSTYMSIFDLPSRRFNKKIRI